MKRGSTESRRCALAHIRLDGARAVRVARCARCGHRCSSRRLAFSHTARAGCLRVQAIKIRKDGGDGAGKAASQWSSSLKIKLENEENPKDTSVELVPDNSTLADVQQLAASMFEFVRDVSLTHKAQLLKDEAVWKTTMKKWNDGAADRRRDKVRSLRSKSAPF